MAAAKKDTKDSSAEVEALKAELEKTRKALAEALKAELEETRKALAESLEQIEKLKEKETGKPAAQPKEKTIKDGHEYVDLGLPSGLKWATCNIGARAPEDYGNYYAWGETSPKTKYTKENSLTYGKQMSDIAGNAQYDAARANWGGNWRMPTKTEMQELINNCTWEWMTQNGKNGYEVTGPNGNKIFLPATGNRYGSSLRDAGSYGGYWISTPHEGDAISAYFLYFNSGNHYVNYYYRYYGRCIRPVSDMAAAKKDTKDSSSEVKAELEKTKKALAEALEQIEKLKNKETGKPAAQPKTIKDWHEYVDLGLSVKWATCNVGASKPEEYGDYFAWGETSPKEKYTEGNSLTFGKQMSDIAGNAQYDAARANWGGNWRMPTETEMQELIDKCKWEWVTVNGVKGYKVTGPNGNKIFLPATGFRYGSSLYGAGGGGGYWSSTPYDSDANNAYGLLFYSDDHGMGNHRYGGRCIRPVEKLKEKETGKPAAQPKEKTIKDGHEYVDLGLSVKWATCNVGANKPEEYGNYYAWGETAPKSEYREDNSKRITLYVPDKYDDVPTVESTGDWSMPTRAEIRELHPQKKLSDIAGYVEYDAATANWGGRWRMPTRSEMQELIDKCTWTRTRQNEVNGYKVTGPNGNSIFLPAAGCRNGSSLGRAGSGGYYWSSTPYGSVDVNAFGLHFDGGYHGMSGYGRYYGLSVRPILE